MNDVAVARAKGWRATYLNRVTVGFWGVHLAALAGVIALGWSWSGLVLAGALYFVRLFFVTAGYHRYFSHRSYKTSRAMQLVLAFGAEATVQKGVLWWAAHHRRHHKDSDLEGDLHSAKRDGFWWSHQGWLMARDFEDTDLAAIKDFAKYPELRWLDRHFLVPPVAVALLCFALGGWHALVWGFFVSTVMSWHGTFTINSLSHLIGARPYETTDDSRNNVVLALLTMGEGWHNNHHHYQVAARQGFRWYQVDATFYILKAMSLVGLVRDLHGVPDHILEGRRKHARAQGLSTVETTSPEAPLSEPSLVA